MDTRPVMRLAALAFTACALAAAAQQQPTLPALPRERVTPLEVVINGAKTGTWLILERGGALFAPRDAFEDWRLQVPTGAQTVSFKGQEYWPLAAVPGFRAKVDFATLTLELVFSPHAFAASRLTRESAKRHERSPVLPSVFLNYDVDYTQSRLSNSRNTTDIGVLSELGFSSGWGVLTTSSIARNLANEAGLEPRRWLRLETAFTRDFPESNRTLRVGDTVTRPAMWGRDVYFGGVRYGTNFALTPGFISQPLPALGGISASPSTVELYVNDVLRQVSRVPTGPFAIDNLPILTGSGEARLVVRDLLGRETVIVQSFFAVTQMLAKGLSDWSVEAGTVRQDLGLRAGQYGPGFAAGTLRHGYNNSLTLEGRVEATRDMALGGAGVFVELPKAFVGKLGVAASHHRDEGDGALWLVGLERSTLRGGASMEVKGASSRFREVGHTELRKPLKLQVAANATYVSDRAGAFGAGFASIERYGEERIATVSANHSIRIGRNGNLAITLSHALSGGTGTSVGINFSMPLGRDHSVSTTANWRSDNRHDLFATASRTPAPDSPVGWRALAGMVQDASRAEAGVYYLGRRGTLSGDLSVSKETAALRLGATGGIVFADGRFFAGRRVEESFAIAEVPGYGDIGVGLGSMMLSRTDPAGIAIIPRLIPYQSNYIRLDPKELPVSAEIDTIEQIVVPSWRSAVKVTFPVRSGRGALLRIVLEDQQPAPAGAVVRIEGEKEIFYVARRGEAFVTGLQPKNRLALEWKGRECRFEVALPPENPDEIPRLGPYACTGVAR